MKSVGQQAPYNLGGNIPLFVNKGAVLFLERQF
jgi:hypothetical protein